MEPYVIIEFLSTLTLIGQLIFVLTMIGLVAFRKHALWDRIGRHAGRLALIVALTATLGSLYFSEIAQFTPCKLCWFQRIFMYPLVIILGLALWRREVSGLASYVLVLSSIGAIIALGHYGMQMIDVPAITHIVPCSAVGVSESCSNRFVTSYGYITIPMMAFTAFALIILLMAIRRWKVTSTPLQA